MYDWANSAFFLIIITAVFPLFYRSQAAAGLDETDANLYYTLATTVALVVVALISPVLGAYADYRARRKRLMAGFVILGVAATGAMFLIGRGDWLLALVLFGIGNVGVATSFVFYDSFLPHIARDDELDRVSTAGYSLGYLGSVLLFAAVLFGIENFELLGLADKSVATRAGFVAVAVWWGLFSLPLFRTVPEPPRLLESDETLDQNALRVTFDRLSETFQELRKSYRHAFLMLLAMLIYNDGIGTVIRLAGFYADDRGIDRGAILGGIVLVNVIGIPFALIFGRLANRIGTKRSILLALGVFITVTFVGYHLDTAAEFYLLAFLVGSVQGGAQALSRSLFASMIPKHKAAEFFGFFAVFEKFAGILGPATFSLMIWLTGSMRPAILAIAVFFVAGAVLLARVDVGAGRREALAAEEKLQVRAVDPSGPPL